MFEKFKVKPEPVISIEDEKASLLKRLAEIQAYEEAERQRIKEEERLEKLKGPAVINVTLISSGTIHFVVEPIMRPDVHEALKKLLPTVYAGINYIKVDNFEKFEEELLKLPNLKFQNVQGIKDPYWKITKQDKHFIVKWNVRTNQYGETKPLFKEEAFKNDYGEDRIKRIYLHQIPGSMRSERLNGITIPLQEAWRLYDLCPEFKTRLYEWESEEIRLEALKEFEKRDRFLKIHTAEDSDVTYQFEHDSEFHLRAHQRVALEFSELTNGKSIIAYSPGTGKTAIALADALKKNCQRILIVCPGALRINWRNHIIKHTGITPLTLAGRIPTKHDERAVMGFRMIDNKLTKVGKPRIIIINYDILRTKNEIESDTPGKLKETDNRFFWVDLLNLYDPEYVIVDEFHYMKNPSSNQSVAVRLLEGKNKMLLSGTPIMNRPGELWPGLNWLYPDQFKYYETFLNEYGWGRNVTNVEALRSILTTIMLKRNRKDITKDMPPINRIEESFEMPPRYRAVYDTVIAGIYRKLAEMNYTGKEGDIKRIEFLLPKLNRMIEVCAAAKVEFTVEKAQELADAMENDEHPKVLIFTKYHGSCSTIARKLGHECLGFVTRTNTGFKMASLPERMELVRQFQTDPNIKYLVATKGTASEGLDITKAGAVIFNDLFWAPGHHTQCERRAFEREGDLHGGESYYLTFDDTIEEWITELQGIKSNTIDQVVEGKGVDYSITNMILERLREAFLRHT